MVLTNKSLKFSNLLFNDSLFITKELVNFISKDNEMYILDTLENGLRSFLVFYLFNML